MGDCPGLDASLGSGGKSDRSPLVQAKSKGEGGSPGHYFAAGKLLFGFKMKEVNDRDGGTGLGLSVLLLD